MLANLRSALQNQPAYRDILARLQGGDSPSSLGLMRSARLPVVSALRDSLRVPLLLITDRTDRALALVDELQLWAPEADIRLFPEPDPLFYEQVGWSESTRRARIRVLTGLISNRVPTIPDPERPLLVVAPARAVITRTLPRREFVKSIRAIRQGQSTPQDTLLREWLKCGYQPSSIVIAPGQFARRGGILDVWPPGDRFPARIEYFGDEIDMLRRFDPHSQRTIEHIDRLLVTPSREYLMPEGSADYLEFHIPFLHPESVSLLHYLPENTLILMEDMDLYRETVQQVITQAESIRGGYVKDGTLAPDAPLPYLTPDEIEENLTAARAVSLGPVSASPGGQLADLFHPNPRFGGELKRFLALLKEIQVDPEAHPVVVSRQASRITELWQEWVVDFPPPEIHKGNLENGWQMRAQVGEDLHLFTDGEIFGWERVQPRRRPGRAVTPPEDHYNDLVDDAWVVHVDHGIGRYRGLVKREISGGEGEYLEIEYAEEDRLYVPVHQADRVTHYVGADTSDPRVTRLGSSQWERVKARVKEDVEEIAADLLKLYARREVVEGYAFNPDTTWQRELEASFPYIETEDQLRVLDEVKSDMEQPRPMDRLICGDVGYGKTEIAVRAAFKAVMDGKQVAVLVPTTVLAQQHYDTFMERMSAFPVEVRMLSRFRTPRQQKEILTALARGAVDIVIGTHRLLSADVFFHDLGLLIVDEEQRFGVANKEQIKKMRANIDVLTLTATPIPRTLYMALTGVRDISRIDTPPEERLPVVTHVGPYEAEVIRRAIWRELERGGQVFFVHNRVKTIQAMRQHISTLVPEARVQVAHGQMPENELSQRMRQFTLGEVDVLLSTSIIESGLDIPNANTLIVDRADMFGLAQLYQLRGRVGRGAQQAYAYFFKDRRQAPTPEGRLRLETIAEHTRLGVGYSVAMRDLEIRGAGDILGTRQSGHIAAVGFHLYTRLLSDAVRRMKGDEDPRIKEIQKDLHFQLEKPLVKIDLPLASGIPAEYIPDQSVRLSLYRRMAALSNLEEVHQLRREFADRFGSIPDQTQQLFIQLDIKVLAEQIGVLAVSVENGKILLIYPEESPLPQKWELPADVRIGISTLYLPFGPGDDGWLERLTGVMDNLRAT